MALPLVPTTELEAVNTMLATIGESPVNSVSLAGVVDAVVAYAILGQINRQVQSVGWTFNTDKDWPLTPVNTSPYEIFIPGNTLSVDTSGVDQGLDLTQRGNRLYDRTNFTFSFPTTVSVKCDIVWLLPYTDLPEPVRYYVAIRASRIFHDRVMGADAIHAYSSSDEMTAKFALKQFESKSADRNLLRGSHVGRILDRNIGNYYG